MVIQYTIPVWLVIVQLVVLIAMFAFAIWQMRK